MKSLRKTIALAGLALCITSATFAQDTETRNVSDNFDAISVSSGIDATLVKGNTNEVEITASGVDLDKVTVDVKRGKLQIGLKQKWWSSWGKKKNIDVVITYTSELEGIFASSGASIESHQTINANDLKIGTSSGAYIDLDIDANDVDIDLSSGSTMDLSGVAGHANIDLSSGASLDAYNLKGDKVEIDGSSGASASIHVTETLEADVSSGANVKYAGNPSNTSIDKSSGGSVRKS